MIIPGWILVLGVVASIVDLNVDKGYSLRGSLSGKSHDSRLSADFADIHWKPIVKLSSAEYIGGLTILSNRDNLKLYRDISGRIAIKVKNAVYAFGSGNCIPIYSKSIYPLIFVKCTEKTGLRGILINTQTFTEYEGSFLLAGISKEDIFLSNTEGSIGSLSFPYPPYIAPAFIIINRNNLASSYLSFSGRQTTSIAEVSRTCSSLSIEKTLLPVKIATNNEEIQMREYSEIYGYPGEKTCKAKFNFDMKSLLGNYL